MFQSGVFKTDVFVILLSYGVLQWLISLNLFLPSEYLH